MVEANSYSKDVIDFIVRHDIMDDFFEAMRQLSMLFPYHKLRVIMLRDPDDSSQSLLVTIMHADIGFKELDAITDLPSFRKIAELVTVTI